MCLNTPLGFELGLNQGELAVEHRANEPSCVTARARSEFALPPHGESCETGVPSAVWTSLRTDPHGKCAVQSLPLPLALTARLLPVAVLAAAGWAMSSGPLAAAPASEQESAQESRSTQTTPEPGTTPSSEASATPPKFTAAPAPCDGLAKATITALVPGAKTAGKEIPSTDESVRRTCSWNALKGYDYRWLDVSFEVMKTEEQAKKSYTERTTEKSGGGEVPGLGEEGYSVVNLTTEDKQQTREGMVLARISNALVSINYNGSDFESKKAPATDEINKGAIKAAKEAMAALENGAKKS